jgi:hypothetical protein
MPTNVPLALPFADKMASLPECGRTYIGSPDQLLESSPKCVLPPLPSSKSRSIAKRSRPPSIDPASGGLMPASEIEPSGAAASKDPSPTLASSIAPPSTGTLPPVALESTLASGTPPDPPDPDVPPEPIVPPELVAPPDPDVPPELMAPPELARFVAMCERPHNGAHMTVRASTKAPVKWDRFVDIANAEHPDRVAVSRDLVDGDAGKGAIGALRSDPDGELDAHSRAGQ